jgi:hypothetical protein
MDLVAGGDRHGVNDNDLERPHHDTTSNGEPKLNTISEKTEANGNGTAHVTDANH